MNRLDIISNTERRASGGAVRAVVAKRRQFDQTARVCFAAPLPPGGND